MGSTGIALILAPPPIERRSDPPWVTAMTDCPNRPRLSGITGMRITIQTHPWLAAVITARAIASTSAVMKNGSFSGLLGGPSTELQGTFVPLGADHLTAAPRRLNREAPLEAAAACTHR